MELVQLAEASSSRVVRIISVLLGLAVELDSVLFLPVKDLAFVIVEIVERSQELARLARGPIGVYARGMGQLSGCVETAECRVEPARGGGCGLIGESVKDRVNVHPVPHKHVEQMVA